MHEVVIDNIVNYLTRQGWIFNSEIYFTKPGDAPSFLQISEQEKINAGEEDKAVKKLRVEVSTNTST